MFLKFPGMETIDLMIGRVMIFEWFEDKTKHLITDLSQLHIPSKQNRVITAAIVKTARTGTIKTEIKTHGSLA